MKLDETMEMAYPRGYVESIIIGSEDPLNEHLVKLVGFDFPAEQRNHFRQTVLMTEPQQRERDCIQQSDDPEQHAEKPQRQAMLKPFQGNF